MKYPEPQQMLGLRVMSKKGLDDYFEIMKNLLITSANKQLSLTQEIIKKAKEANADRKVYTCDMYPESAFGIHHLVSE